MKNKHIEHPEDLILTGDLTVLDLLLQDGYLSTKMDGAPAVVWGTNPATGNFFVGTKSVFNKVKIKINESHADIDANHEGEVADILHACFDWLPNTGGIFQGDFIGFGGQSEYKPNTITYVFDDVINQNIIIAPHTVYTAESDLRDAIAQPMKFTITDTSYCKFVKPVARIFTGNYDTCAGSFADVSEPIEFAKMMAQTVDFVDDKKAAEIKKKLNKCIRENISTDDIEFDCDWKLISFWKLVKSIKDDALYLCRNNGPRSYIGEDEISAEGYVFSNELGTIKLVNRERFSYANFNNTKFQQSV
tara:strand:+ start:584 stop:1495 length:912 start_codon:yes stop_codon:yes gene_type:complete